jgi:hypothetical protein
MTRLAHILAVALAFGSAGQDSRIAAFPQAQPYGDPVLAAIATAAEMPPLDSTTLSPGYREIRIRSEQSIVNLESRPMLRLVEGPNEIRGALWLFRTLVLRPGNPMPREDERCVPLGEQHICARPWQLSSGDWMMVAARLEQMGAWTLSEPCNRMRTVDNGGTRSITIGISGDSGLLSVQRRIGSTESSFLCFGPGYERQDDGLKANGIYTYLLGLSGVVPPEPIRIAK